MRITGGFYKGRTILCPPGVIRPAMDRMRESLVPHPRGPLRQLLPGPVRRFGVIGVEAASRGAEPVVFVEKDPGKRRRPASEHLLRRRQPEELHLMPAERFLAQARPHGDRDYGVPGPALIRLRGKEGAARAAAGIRSARAGPRTACSGPTCPGRSGWARRPEAAGQALGLGRQRWEVRRSRLAPVRPRRTWPSMPPLRRLVASAVPRLVAQSAEHILGKEGVLGSIPSGGSYDFPHQGPLTLRHVEICITSDTAITPASGRKGYSRHGEGARERHRAHRAAVHRVRPAQLYDDKNKQNIQGSWSS